MVSRPDTNRISDSVSGMAGIRGHFTTGFVSHKVNVGYSAMTKRNRSKMSATADNPTTNIYHNTGDVGMPDSSNFNGSGGNTAIRLTSGRTRTQGWLLSDTPEGVDDKLLFTLLVHVIRKWSFAGTTKLPVRKTTRTVLTAAAGCQPTVWFINRRKFHFYANQPTEALQPGKTAPNTATNYGQSTGIVHSARMKWA